MYHDVRSRMFAPPCSSFLGLYQVWIFHLLKLIVLVLLHRAMS